jgi:glucose/arabinose dehydrogenase
MLIKSPNSIIMNTYFIKRLPLLGLLLLISCGGNSKNTNAQQQVSVDGKLQNPETAEKNAPDYRPAFAGQTRIEGVKTSTPYSVDVINSDLKKPWAIINLPDGRLLVTEKSGYMNIISADGKTVSKLEGLPEVDANGQGGLLDVALDPEFATNRMIFWTFSEPVSGGNHTAVAKGRLSTDEKSIENSKVIFRATPTYDGDKHFGSRLVFDKDGHLFVSTGERSDLETRPYAQKQDAYLGKVLKITKDGKPAPGNPAING